MRAAHAQGAAAAGSKTSAFAGFADRDKFNPDLENIVIKALTGASIARNEFFSLSAKARDDANWEGPREHEHYLAGVALYLSFAMHIAAVSPSTTSARSTPSSRCMWARGAS